MLSALVSPLLLLAGSGAVSVPILIHLLARRRFKRIRWAAIDFLILAEKQNRRKINLQELILLILRCLAIFLLGLMVARPYLSPTGLAGVLGSKSVVERIFILDDSLSMSYTKGATSSFDQAKTALVKLLEQSRHSPSDRITILTTTNPDKPLASAMSLGGEELADLRKVIDGLRPTSSAARFGDILARLSEELADNSRQLSTALYIISDFQKKDWLAGAGSGDSVASSPLRPFRKMTDERTGPTGRPRHLAISLVHVDRAPRPNMAVTSLTTPQAQIVQAIDNEFSVKISNYGNNPTEAFEAKVFLNDSEQSSVSVPAIAPRQSATVRFSVTLPTEGYHFMRVEIPADALAGDDRRSAVWSVQSAINVLLINGEPSIHTIEDETALLRTALSPQGEVYSGFQVTVADESEFGSAALEKVHLVILANVYRVMDEAVRRLEEFVLQGGGLVIFLGDQVDADLYNDRLWRDGAGLLPCQLGQALGTPARTGPTRRGQSAVTMIDPDPLHPVTRVFGGQDNPLLSSSTFNRYFECMVLESLVETGGPGFQTWGLRDSTLPTSEDMGHPAPDLVRVLVRLSGPKEHPAIVEKLFGRGKVLLFTSSADTEWNDWPKWPSYVVAMQELGHYAAKAAPAQTTAIVGGEMRMTIDPAQYHPNAILRTPNYPSEAQTVVHGSLSDDENVYELSWTKTDHAGIYHLLLDNLAGQQQEIPLAVNLDPQESDLATCKETDLRRSAPEVEFNYVPDVNTLRSDSPRDQREYWPIILITIVALLTLEQTLACWFGRANR